MVAGISFVRGSRRVGLRIENTRILNYTLSNKSTLSHLSN